MSSLIDARYARGVLVVFLHKVRIEKDASTWRPLFVESKEVNTCELDFEMPSLEELRSR